MVMLMSMALIKALTLMQTHSGLAEENIQRWIISTTKQDYI